ncbi:MAG: carbamoyltransferase HypF [Coriobacteriales bacterium]|jgi:hydrogenase maturation protein HypF|nr:carbamoyltransferase HypF [Coriobacteriales bacterium]
MKAARDLHIRGIVQGVGFRPFVYRQATRWGLDGWVLNAGDGVHAHIEGDPASLCGFMDELEKRAPAAARITALEVAEGQLEGSNGRGFAIRSSDEQTAASTLVSPDIATCPECLHELFDPQDRRFHYPFINCTNCGPRFTIIDALPYDRPNTSMAPFAMCATCDAEYHDPLNRRFHAQPDACFDCGPALRLWQSGEGQAAEGDGGDERGERGESDKLLERVAQLLGAGRIVALKGLGGYHLACDATNEEAVALLRKRKRRSAKPFALMVRSLAGARELCQVGDREAALLSGTVRPIVLLRRKPRPAGSSLCAPLAPSVAGDLHELGIMLPYTPVQHLLMTLVDGPLVMTSGNISEEPIIAQESEAHELLGGVADAFLDNDRAILSRYDDSVVRVIDEKVYLIRRARGYAPEPLPFPRSTPGGDDKRATEHRPSILAVGPEQKNTFCFVRGEEAFCSQHLGDLESASAFEAWRATLKLYQQLFGVDYAVVTCDTHPEYLSTKWARARDEARVEVQHHHAHIASVLEEHRTDATGEARLIERVIGVAFDGTGYGDDGTLWGGEVLIARLEDFERFAHLHPVALPGGKAAIEHPGRMAWSYLRAFGLTEHRGAVALAASLGADRLLLLDQIIAGRINTPLTSSMGRLFDAASALAGVCSESSYEGQAAVELEAALYDPATGLPTLDLAAREAAERYRFRVEDGQPSLIIDPSPVLGALLDDRAAQVPAALISLRFHEAVLSLIAELCDWARARSGLTTVALSGGVFMNRYLLSRSVPLLESEGFTVLVNRRLPANDGCISYGQAAIAAARVARLAEEGIPLGA